MNNKDKLNNAFNQIHAPEDLKQKTFEKMTNNKKENKFFIPKLAQVAAVLLIIFTASYTYINRSNPVKNTDNTTQIATMDKLNPDLPRFKNMEELLNILKENETSFDTVSAKSSVAIEDFAMAEESTSLESANSETMQNTRKDYSETNNQVKNVDEADVVKTDGENIYYVANGNVYIIQSSNLELLSEIKGYQDENNNETFSPYNIFINGKKLIVIGNYNKYETVTASADNEEDYYIDTAYLNYKNITKACVYNLTDVKNPKLEREVCLEGYYKDARMIKDSVYFISNKYIGYYNTVQTKDEDILPTVSDSLIEEEKLIQCTDIAYFPGTNNYSFMLIGGFNINNNNPVKVETIFGASDTVYCSENNLYLTDTIYEEYYTNSKIAIYKFELDDSNVVLKAKTEVKGYLNNQFSMDEYEGNLRIAVTVDSRSNLIDELVENFTDYYVEEKTENRLYVLDENLEEIGRIDNIAVGEKIYAVRFIEKVAYVVTFEQVDPLFVIDLSNPRKPEIKGELKIPGYSSYLHPYDENHIIGIGYNTKDNGYGGVTNTNMKMSMFDVSDLNSPKEMFSIDIGKDWSYSDLLHDHKALFFKKADDLIGLPYSTYAYGENNYWNFEIFHIDLENGFERYYNFTHKNDNRTNIKRMIYIEDIVYGLAEQKIMAYDLNTGELLHELDLEDNNYIDDRNILY